MQQNRQAMTSKKTGGSFKISPLDYWENPFEVCNYQAMYVGKVYANSEMTNEYEYTTVAEQMKRKLRNGMLKMDGLCSMMGAMTFAVIDGVLHIQDFVSLGETEYYVLNVSNDWCLCNGFI